MKSKLIVVFLKELKEALRERRTLSMLALFVLMYPLMVAFILQKEIGEAVKPKEEGIAITVIGGKQAPTLMSQLAQKNINATDSGPLNEEAITTLLAKRQTVAVLRLADQFGTQYASMRPAGIEIWFDSAAENNNKRQKVEDVVREYSTQVASARLLAHGVSPVILQPVRLQRYDTATSASRSATVIRALLAAFFLPAFLFGISTAVDATAGERERRSLEVLMAQPVSAVSIIGGKWLAAGVLSIIGLTMELCLAHGILKSLALEEIGMSWRLTELHLAMAIFATIPLCLMAAALQILLAMNAKTFKEAQTTVSLVTLVPMIPIFVVPMLKLTNGDWMYAVPVLANQTLLTELAKGSNIGPLPYLLTFGVTLAIAMACLTLAIKRMKSEKYILSV